MELYDPSVTYLMIEEDGKDDNDPQCNEDTYNKRKAVILTLFLADNFFLFFGAHIPHPLYLCLSQGCGNRAFYIAQYVLAVDGISFAGGDQHEKGVALTT